MHAAHAHARLARTRTPRTRTHASHAHARLARASTDAHGTSKHGGARTFSRRTAAHVCAHAHAMRPVARSEERAELSVWLAAGCALHLARSVWISAKAKRL
eukprot:3243790-Pleurochrysis_carterae.AAC.1